MTQINRKRTEIRANICKRSTVGPMDVFYIVEKIDLSYFELYRLLCFIRINDYIHKRYLEQQQKLMEALENLLSDFPKALGNTNEVLTFRERPDETENGFRYLEHKHYSLLKEKFSERLEIFHKRIVNLRSKSIERGDAQRQTVFIAMLEVTGPLSTHLTEHPESPISSDESLASGSPIGPPSH